MLWSIGKDSTVLLWLARKAFLGHVPFPLVHIDTSFKLPEMIQYRDTLAMEYQLQMVVGENREALDAKTTYPDTQHLPDGHPDKISRVQCCAQLKSGALRGTLHGTLPRKRMNLKTGQYEPALSLGPAPTKKAAGRKNVISHLATRTTRGMLAINPPNSGTSSKQISRQERTFAFTRCLIGPN